MLPSLGRQRPRARQAAAPSPRRSRRKNAPSRRHGGLLCPPTPAARSESAEAPQQPPSAAVPWGCGSRLSLLRLSPRILPTPPLRVFSFGRRRPAWALGTPLLSRGSGSTSAASPPLPAPPSVLSVLRPVRGAARPGLYSSRRRGAGGDSASPPSPRVSGPAAARRYRPVVARPTNTWQVNGTLSPPSVHHLRCGMGRPAAVAAKAR